MVVNILRDTPVWVWCVLILVLWRGYAFTRPHSMSRNRILLIPSIFVALSLLGAVSTFGLKPTIVAAWLAGIAITATIWSRMRRAAPFALRQTDDRYQVPGSWFPLIVIVVAFLVRYGVGITLAFHSELQQATLFGAACVFVFGCVTGAFFGRALNIIFNAKLFRGMHNEVG